MKTIPNNKIIQSKGLGDTIGDIVSSFNLDLSSNYGAIRATRMKKVTVTPNSLLQKPIAFANFQSVYWALADNELWKGGDTPSDAFTEFDSFNLLGDIDEGNSDMKVFNGGLYFSGSTEVYKTTNGTSFTTAISSGLTTSPHLMEVMNAGAVSRLYITDNFTKVRSISTGDVLTSDGQAYSLNLNLPPTEWTITTIKKNSGLIWVGLLNIYNGTGLVVSWDGYSADQRNETYNLPSGVVSSTVLDNVLYIIDTQGQLKYFAGNSFKDVEGARLFRDNKNFLQGSGSLNNSRFIHPNGMVTTDEGTILIMLSNQIGNYDYEDGIPSGIWEYDKNIGLYHKYSISVSPVGATTYTDFGQQRLSSPGALFYAKPTGATATKNGILLAGATYFTNASTTAYGIFCDDTLDTTEKYAGFITTKLFTKIQEQWNKVYALYKKFTNSSSEIIIKYRTEEDTPTESTVTWTDIDRFTSSVSLSSYSVGDEIQIVQGVYSGFTAHILSTDGTTYIIDEQLPSSCIGVTGKVLVSKWKKVGTGKVTYNDKEQFKALTLVIQNTSPFIQLKVCMKFNTKDELNKLQIISKELTKEE